MALRFCELRKIFFDEISLCNFNKMFISTSDDVIQGLLTHFQLNTIQWLSHYNTQSSIWASINWLNWCFTSEILFENNKCCKNHPMSVKLITTKWRSIFANVNCCNEQLNNKGVARREAQKARPPNRNVDSEF